MTLAPATVNKCILAARSLAKPDLTDKRIAALERQSSENCACAGVWGGPLGSGGVTVVGKLARWLAAVTGMAVTSYTQHSQLAPGRVDIVL